MAVLRPCPGNQLFLVLSCLLSQVIQVQLKVLAAYLRFCRVCQTCSSAFGRWNVVATELLVGLTGETVASAGCFSR